MMRHGFRGAAEISATLEHMAAFAHLAGAVPPHLFDLYCDATLGNDEVRRFMRARQSGGTGCDRNLALPGCMTHRSGQTRRNSIAAALQEAA